MCLSIPEMLVDLRALRPGPESPGTAGRHRWPLDPDPSNPGELVDPECIRTGAPVARDSWSTPRALGCKCKWAGTAGVPQGPSDPGLSRPGNLVDPRGLGHGPESPLRPGGSRGSSEQGPSRQRHRVELAGPGTRARVARDCWSTPQALRRKRKSPGRAGRPRGPSDPGPSCPGHLVDSAGHRAWARVPGDS